MKPYEKGLDPEAPRAEPAQQRVMQLMGRSWAGDGKPLISLGFFATHRVPCKPAGLHETRTGGIMLTQCTAAEPGASQAP
jgi:hypothetical protein